MAVRQLAPVLHYRRRAGGDAPDVRLLEQFVQRGDGAAFATLLQRYVLTPTPLGSGARAVSGHRALYALLRRLGPPHAYPGEDGAWAGDGWAAQDVLAALLHVVIGTNAHGVDLRLRPDDMLERRDKFRCEPPVGHQNHADHLFPLLERPLPLSSRWGARPARPRRFE